jgi:AmpD protein
MSAAASPAGPLTVGPDGWIGSAQRLTSPNCDDRPAGCTVQLLVVHCISLPPGDFRTRQIERLFANELDPGAHPFFAPLQGLRLSAHFLIGRDGQLSQFVSCAQRAWHAGRSAWDGRSDCNDFSIGVELVGSEFEPFTEAQYATFGALQAALCAAYPIRATRGHSEIAPGRKFDPGPLFDWSRVARDGASEASA